MAGELELEDRVMRALKRSTVAAPFTGEEYLESLRDGREVWIYGHRVKDVTSHPAFRNSARSVARLYDALHDPELAGVLTTETDTGSGGRTHRFFKAPCAPEDLRLARDAIAAWQRLGYGWMGRSPDYKAAFMATLGANAEFYEPFQENARRWYRQAQERVMYLNHAIIHPPVDRDRAPDDRSDVCVHVERETDAGVIVSGAKVVATASAITHCNFIAHHGVPLQQKPFALVFIAPMDAPGVKLLCRASYEMTAACTGSPFDYPLSSRLDENDAVMVFDRALIPWENVFVYGDVEKANSFFPQSGFLPRFSLHGATRLAVKLDFICGVLLKAVEATGTMDVRAVQANLGEVIVWRSAIWALSDAMIQSAEPWVDGFVQPNLAYGLAYRVLAPIVYGRIKEIIEHTVGTGLIYVTSNAADFRSDEIRPYLDKYLRGSGGYSAVDRVKVMKLLWDAVGSEFGGRHELYERNYAGNTEENRVQALRRAMASGAADGFKALVDECLSEYDVHGWTVPDMVAPDDVSMVSPAPSSQLRSAQPAP